MTVQTIKNRLGLGLALAKAHFKIKIEDSYLGFFWYSLNPLLTFCVMLLVFSRNLGSNIPHYPLYLLVGITMFNFFQVITLESTKIVRSEYSLMRSIKIPHEVFIIAIILKNLFSHIFEIAILVIFFLCFHAPLQGILLYPFVILFFCLFITGISLVLFSFRVHMLDFGNIWDFFSRLIWLGTPIFYSSEHYGKWMFINYLNPIYYFITIAREVLIYSRWPSGQLILGAFGYSMLFLGIGLMIFNKLKPRFNELV